MAVDVSTEIVIRQPQAKVAAYAATPSNAPSWYVNIRSVDWNTGPVVGTAARAACVAEFLGRTLAYTYEIVDYRLGDLLVMRTAEGPFPMETSYAWAATPEGHTRMTLRNRGTPAGFSKL